MSGFRKRRGQALVEMALILPVLVLLMLGAADLGRAYYIKLEMSGASRAGMRMGVLGTGVDIGNAVRAEPNSAIPNTTAAWGANGPGGLNDCDPTQSTHKCGDQAGCAPGANWTTGQVACFAVRTCIVWTNGTCSSVSTWGTRPAAAADQGVEVLTVYRFQAATPIIAAFAPNPGGIFYLSADTVGLQLY
ncbi:MAG TPA: TadE family protein [Candidatus Limnocylindrales bacterium]|nr:TadE family protein [Candidatus Limnocylindrales bacterium]